MNLNERIARIKQLDKNLIPEAIEDAERYRSIAMMKTTSFENDGSQNLHTENKVEQRLIDYTIANQKVDKLQDELVDLKLELLTAVNNIENNKQRRFAKLYYVDGLTQRKIAQLTFYSPQTVKNVLSQANKVLEST